LTIPVADPYLPTNCVRTIRFSRAKGLISLAIVLAGHHQQFNDIRFAAASLHAFRRR
jgi:hypothetical protein